MEIPGSRALSRKKRIHCTFESRDPAMDRGMSAEKRYRDFDGYFDMPFGSGRKAACNSSIRRIGLCLHNVHEPDGNICAIRHNIGSMTNLFSRASSRMRAKS